MKNIKIYVKNMKEYVRNMKKYMKNMKEYVGNIKNYVENMKEYEEICRYIRFCTAHVGSETWTNSNELSFHIVSVLKRNSMPKLPVRF